MLERRWHIEGRSVRPDHRMVAHTGFLTTARLVRRGASNEDLVESSAGGATAADAAVADDAERDLHREETDAWSVDERAGFGPSFGIVDEEP